MTDLERRVHKLEVMTDNGTSIFVRKESYLIDLKVIAVTQQGMAEDIHEIRSNQEADVVERATTKRQVGITLLVASLSMLTQFGVWLLNRLGEAGGGG
jgi:hypothetical protein